MFGKYKLNRLLGQGGMGEVYEAYDTSKDRTVALKILRQELSNDERFRNRFQRESHAAAMLEEPHVIPIYDWGETDGSLFIDMRLVRGQDLHELLKRGPLEPDRAVAIVRQIAVALDAAHAQGMIHRDVKPQNILVTSTEDFAYLIDFGIAQNLDDTRLTVAGSAIGSFAYMAPERFEDRPTTSSVDVYSLAAVLFEAVTGQPPFTAPGVEQLIAAHMSAPPPQPSVVNPHVPPAFDDVIARGMAKDPDDRYGSAGALGRAAQRALTGKSSSGRSFGPFAAGEQARTGPAGAGPYDGGPTRPAWQAAEQTPNQARPWLVPTVIIVAAALLLGGIGVIIGLLAHQNNPPSTPRTPTTGPITAAPNSEQGQGPTSVQALPPPVPASPPPPAAPARPPLISGPDTSASHESCDYGWSLNNNTGWGSHAGRGTPETSCYFAGSVLKSYWNEYGNASRQLRTVSAPGAVDCNTVAGAVCDGSNFLMQCAAYGSDNWITCTGGHGARVYLY
ncbi:serine/threonine protein kinase [Mycobacterium sp. 852002-51057_SCH5723018]|nr:serine/threonine-protein kinase [Mycobacterium sp. 852002-51057_SCH5723018]OBG18773.1 serine/threonine protein kinase [Mycobacterium sp. 852002-51057_SCH5723018]